MKINNKITLIFILSSLSFNILSAERTKNHEVIINKVCSSPDPVLIIDNFPGNSTNKKNIDLNADGTFETHHGEFTEKIVQLNGQTTIRVKVGTPIYPQDLGEILTPIVEKLEKGELKVSWINFSQGHAVEIRDFNNLIRNERNGTLITGDNVHLFGEKIINKLMAKKPKFKLKKLKSLFLRLEKLGVPFVIAGTNSGYKEINIYSLLPNTISVGSLDLKERKAYYSADNSTVTIWRTGEIESYAVNDGLDLNNDAFPDVDLMTPLIPKNLLTSLQGLYVFDSLKEVPKEIDEQNDNNRETFNGLISKLPEGLYETKYILGKTRGTPYAQVGNIKYLGPYFYLSNNYSLPLFFFDIDASGNIKIKDKIRNEDHQLRNILIGTSFSSPNICNGQTTPKKMWQF